LPHDRENLKKEIRQANVICLVYSDHYSYERVALFWLPHFRSLGVNVPVVLCANKSDLATNQDTAQAVEEEMLPLLAEFKEIDSCIRTSAKEKYNIIEMLSLCQKAVTQPIAPLWDSREGSLKPLAVAALERIFFLCDKDQDGALSDAEMQALQTKCFDRHLPDDKLASSKQAIARIDPKSVTENGITSLGFLNLMKLYVENGRHGTIWLILRAFHYTDSISLQETFLFPRFDVPPFSSAELSPSGYRFFVDLFILFDKDNDGGLNDAELDSLFAPTPGLPHSWVDAAFPSSTVRNDNGHITLQGWLAQWSMTTYAEPKTTLSYLAYLGFETAQKGGTVNALKVTKPRKRRRRLARVERNVVSCFVVGGGGSGKSSLLDSFLNRSFTEVYHPTIKPRTAVNSVELAGGKQVYLILQELGELEPAILENESKLASVDVIAYVYDSSDPDSFVHILELYTRYPALSQLPSLFIATKADRDRTTQRSAVQPDDFTNSLNLPHPLHVSVTWSSIAEVFTQVADAALLPGQAMARTDQEARQEEGEMRRLWYVAGASVAVGAAVGGILWRRNAGNV
jgi:Ras family protein T1